MIDSLIGKISSLFSEEGALEGLLDEDGPVQAFLSEHYELHIIMRGSMPEENLRKKRTP